MGDRRCQCCGDKCKCACVACVDSKGTAACCYSVTISDSQGNDSLTLLFQKNNITDGGGRECEYRPIVFQCGQSQNQLGYLLSITDEGTFVRFTVFIPDGGEFRLDLTDKNCCFEDTKTMTIISQPDWECITGDTVTISADDGCVGFGPGGQYCSFVTLDGVGPQGEHCECANPSSMNGLTAQLGDQVLEDTEGNPRFNVSDLHRFGWQGIPAWFSEAQLQTVCGIYGTYWRRDISEVNGTITLSVEAWVRALAFASFCPGDGDWLVYSGNAVVPADFLPEESQQTRIGEWTRVNPVQLPCGGKFPYSAEPGNERWIGDEWGFDILNSYLWYWEYPIVETEPVPKCLDIAEVSTFTGMRRCLTDFDAPVWCGGSHYWAEVVVTIPPDTLWYCPNPTLPPVNRVPGGDYVLRQVLAYDAWPLPPQPGIGSAEDFGCWIFQEYYPITNGETCEGQSEPLNTMRIRAYLVQVGKRFHFEISVEAFPGGVNAKLMNPTPVPSAQFVNCSGVIDHHNLAIANCDRSADYDHNVGSMDCQNWVDYAESWEPGFPPGAVWGVKLQTLGQAIWTKDDLGP